MLFSLFAEPKNARIQWTLRWDRKHREKDQRLSIAWIWKTYMLYIEGKDVVNNLGGEGGGSYQTQNYYEYFTKYRRVCVCLCVYKECSLSVIECSFNSAAKVYTPDWAESIKYSETWHSTKCFCHSFQLWTIFQFHKSYRFVDSYDSAIALLWIHALATDWRNNCARIFFSEAFSWNSTRYYLCIQVVFLRINSLLCTLYCVEIVHILWKYDLFTLSRMLSIHMFLTMKGASSKRYLCLSGVFWDVALFC